ncbi:MAG: biopolymer transporter ExbD, partial [Acidobacteria bacterium]|nr:biopolymer transporter ExbD [Acidobacteriota bacterium]
TKSGEGEGSLAEINITPFVDVVLVLLVIFMLTARVMEFGVDVDVPRTKQVSETTKEMPVVNISAQGELFVNSDPVNINELAKKLGPLLGKDRSAYLRADKRVEWGIVAQVMSELNFAGVKVSAVTQPLETSPKRK